MVVGRGARGVFDLGGPAILSIRYSNVPLFHYSNMPSFQSNFMNQALQDKIESAQFRKGNATFAVGDTVRVHTKVVEGDKERIQIFSGVVIGRRGHGLNETFTVRRISYGEGVERVFPLHSPRVEKVEVEREGSVRRAKLTYLRKRLGKGATLVREKEGRAAAIAPVAPTPEPAAEPA